MGRSTGGQRRALEVLRRPEEGAGETRPVVVSPADPSKAKREVVQTLHQLIETLNELSTERPRDDESGRDPNLPLLLNGVEAGKVLSISRAKVLDLASRGQLPSMRVGGSVRIPRDMLLAWIADNGTLAGPAAPASRRRGYALGSDDL